MAESTGSEAVSEPENEGVWTRMPDGSLVEDPIERLLEEGWPPVKLVDDAAHD